jgi:hypothetical protein
MDEFLGQQRGGTGLIIEVVTRLEQESWAISGQGVGSNDVCDCIL